MYSSVIVPLDGSVHAERALWLAEETASRLDLSIRLVSHVPTERMKDDRVELLGNTASGLGVPVSVEVVVDDAGVIDDLASAITRPADGLLCMSSYGRGRTGALLGSIAEGLLRRVPGPVFMVGPQCEGRRFKAGDAMVVAVDGSPATDLVVAVAGSWSAALDLSPWLVSCVGEGVGPSALGSVGDLPAESAGLHRLADRMRSEVGREVNWDVLHGPHPADDIAAFAGSTDAAMIVMGSHGATGVRRLAMGSVSAATVRRAPCPVLVQRTLS